MVKLTARYYLLKCPWALKLPSMLPQHVIRRLDEPVTRVSSDLITERIKANLEALNEQISTLNPLMNELIQENSHVTPQQRVPLLIGHNQDTRPVVKLELPEPCRRVGYQPDKPVSRLNK